MKLHYIQDRFNLSKFWIVGRTECRHYTLSQALRADNGTMTELYKHKRRSLYRISECIWLDKKLIQNLFK